MAKKVAKKVDVKKVSKMEVNKHIMDLFTGLGIGAEDGVLYGFTEGTIVLHMEKCDVQVKLITPKAGIDKYEKLEDEEEDEEVTEE